MQVETSNAPAKIDFKGTWIYFCSDNCRERFEKSPEYQRSEAVLSPVAASVSSSPAAGAGEAIDPVCGMSVDIATAQYKSTSNGSTYYFCASGCKEHFDNHVQDERKEKQVDDNVKGEKAKGATAIDPICGMSVDIATAQYTATVKDTEYYFCNPSCKEKFLAQHGA